MFHICNSSLDTCFATSERLDLESHYQSRVEAALEFACRIDGFDDFMDPHRLYDHCLGPKPSEYVLRKILWEEKNTYILLFWSPFSFYFCFLSLSLVLFLQRWPLGIARTNVHVLGEWRMNICLDWLLKQRNANWMRRKVKWPFLPPYYTFFSNFVPHDDDVYASHLSLQREEQGWKKRLGGSAYSSWLGSQRDYKWGA